MYCIPLLSLPDPTRGFDGGIAGTGIDEQKSPKSIKSQLPCVVLDRGLAGVEKRSFCPDGWL